MTYSSHNVVNKGIIMNMFVRRNILPNFELPCSKLFSHEIISIVFGEGLHHHY